MSGNESNSELCPHQTHKRREISGVPVHPSSAVSSEWRSLWCLCDIWFYMQDKHNMRRAHSTNTPTDLDLPLGFGVGSQREQSQASVQGKPGFSSFTLIHSQGRGRGAWALISQWLSFKNCLFIEIYLLHKGRSLRLCQGHQGNL